MNQLLKLISDGDGSPSTMRVGFIIVLLAVVIPKVYIAIHTSNPVTFTDDDLKVLGTIFGAKAAQSYFENKTPAVPKP